MRQIAIMCGFLFMILPSPARSQQKPPTSRPNSHKQQKAHCDGLQQITVYVPYQRFKKLTKSEGVFLTQKQYEKLISVVRREKLREQKKLPVPYILTKAEYKGEAKEQGIQLKVRIQLQVFPSKNWTLVPISLSGLPLQKAQINGKTALLIARKKGFDLLIKKAGSHTLELTLAGKLKQSPGTRQLYLHIPRTPYTHVEMKIQGIELKASLNGSLIQNQTLKNGFTNFSTSMGPRSQLKLQWSAKQKRKSERKSLLSANIIGEHSFRKGILRSTFEAKIQILQAKTKSLQFFIPKGFKIISVNGGNNLKSWQVEQLAKQQRLNLHYHRKFGKKYSLRLELEKLLSPKNGKPVQIPSFHLANAEWERGYIALYNKGSFKLKPTQKKNLTQIGPQSYFEQTQRSFPIRAFSYFEPNYKLSVAMIPIKPKIRATVFHRLDFGQKWIQYHAKAKFQIEDAGVFQLRFALPKGWEYRDVKGENIQSKYIAKEQTKSKQKILVVVFKRKVGGPKISRNLDQRKMRTTFYHFQRNRRKYNLTSWQIRTLLKLVKNSKSRLFLNRILGNPIKKRTKPYSLTILMRQALSIKQAKTLPLIRTLDTLSKDEQGYVGLYLQDHLNVEIKEVKELFELDETNHVQHKFGRPQDRRLELRQAFRYNRRPASGKIQLKQKKTTIEAQVWLPYSIREDGLSLKAQIRYKVRYASTNKISFQVPQRYAKKIQLQTPVRESKQSSKDGLTTFSLTLHNKIRKNTSFNVVFNYQQKWPKTLEVGKAQRMQLQAVTVPKAIKQEVYFGIKKQDSFSTQALPPKTTERIDITELPSFASKGSIARAFRSLEQQPAALPVQVKKHRYQPVLSTYVSHLHVDAIVTREGNVQTLAYIRLQSQGRQFLKIRLPKKAQVLALRVGTKDRFRLELDQKGELLIDIASIANGSSFLIALQYQYPLSSSKAFEGMSGQFKVQAPEIAETPISRTTFYLYLPKRYTYTHFKTKMWKNYISSGPWQWIRTQVTNANGWYMSGFQGVSLLQRQASVLSNKFPKRGQKFFFLSLSNQRAVQISYRTNWWQGFLEFFVFLFVFGVMLWFGRLKKASTNKWVLLSSFALLSVFSGLLLPESAATFSTYALFSTFTMGAGWGFFAIYAAVRKNTNDSQPLPKADETSTTSEETSDKEEEG